MIIELPLSVDLAKFNGNIGQLFESINAHLSTMGVSEKLGASAEVAVCTITVEREFSQTELYAMRNELQRVIDHDKPELCLIVGKPRCKSGKSSSQSTAV